MRRRFQLQLIGEALLGPVTDHPLFLVVRIHRARDVGRLQFATPDRSHHILDRGARQPGQRPLQLVVGIFDLGAGKQAIDDAAAKPGILIAHGGTRGAANGRPRLAGDGERLPGRWRRRLRLRGQYLDLVAVLQFGRQGCEFAVDLAPDRAVADVGMHGIGKVDHIGLTRQRDQFALRGKAEHLVVEQLQLGVLQKLFRIGAFGENADGMAQPGKGVGFVFQPFGGRAHAFLVERMRGDAEFRDLVHLLGADLQLDALLAGADHGGMDRAIVVLLRRRDVVLETPGHHRPGGVDDAERAVAGLDICHHDAEAVDVGQLLEADRFALHLGPDRKRLLAAAVDPRRDAVLLQVLRQLAFDLADQIAVALRQRVQPLHHHRVGFRIERMEREILEFLAHLLHAHAAGEGRIDVQRLLGDAAARGVRHEFQRAHVVQPIGELDQQHADVVGNRQQQLAQVLGLLGLARDQLQPFQLGEPFDQRADLVAEDLVDLGARRLGILDGVVEQGRHDGGVVELEPGQNRRDLERMREIRIAGRARLAAVRLHGVDIGAIEQILVGIRIIRPDTLDEVVLPHHPRPRRFGPLGHGQRRRYRDRIGRGLHLPGSATPERHRATASARRVGTP